MGLRLTPRCEVQTRSQDGLEALGGIEGLAQKLDTSLHHGLTTGEDGHQLERRAAVFGENKFRTAETKAFWAIVFENLRDPTLILLMAAALVPFHQTSNATLAFKPNTGGASIAVCRAGVNGHWSGHQRGTRKGCMDRRHRNLGSCSGRQSRRQVPSSHQQHQNRPILHRNGERTAKFHTMMVQARATTTRRTSSSKSCMLQRTWWTSKCYETGRKGWSPAQLC